MTKLRFGIVGQYQSGKSLLINCLINRHVATVGVGIATTHTVVNYSFSELEFAEIVYDSGTKETCDISRLEGIDTNKTIKTVNVFLNNDFLKDYTLTDMPGFGFNETDNKVALEALEELDYAIVVVSNEKSFGTDSPQYRDFCLLQRYNIPYYLVLNCKDIVKDNCWHPYHDININRMHEDLHIVDFYKPICYPFNEGHIPIVNLMWYWYGIHDHDDKILKRREIHNAIQVYDLPSYSRSEIKEASNFHLIKKIFDMDNRAYLELKKEIQLLKNEICPVGTIQAFAFNKVPQGWMICDGRSLNKYEYAELFNVIANTFGNEGNDKFKIPDLRGRFIRGWDPKATIYPDRRDFGTYQEDAIQSHNHSFYSKRVSLSSSGDHSHTTKATRISIDQGMFSSVKVVQWLSSSGDDTGSTTSNGDHTHELKLNGNPISLANNARTSTETRPKNCALLFCIKVSSNT